MSYFTRSRSEKENRRGSVAVLATLLMIVMLACVAFAVDVGYLYVTRTELQNVADASALAGVSKLYPLADSVEQNSFYLAPDIAGARAESQNYARYNGAGEYQGTTSSTSTAFQLDANYANAIDGDIVIGRFDDASNRSLPLIRTEVFPNTVQVTSRLINGHANGSVSLAFARALGFTDTDVSATASATLIYASLLPFATSKDKWDSLKDGGDGDDYTYNRGVTVGVGDGIPEIVIFPDLKWDGTDLPPGNFGALSIGTDTSSAAILRRQIDRGPTPAELEYHGVWESGMEISGKTGVNSTVKTAFAGGWDTSDLRYYEGILGYPRFLPVYDNVQGNGTNSIFRLVKFVGVRVMGVDLTGKNKWIRLQPIEDTKNLMTVRLTR